MADKPLAHKLAAHLQGLHTCKDCAPARIGQEAYTQRKKVSGALQLSGNPCVCMHAVRNRQVRSDSSIRHAASKSGSEVESRQKARLTINAFDHCVLVAVAHPVDPPLRRQRYFEPYCCRGVRIPSRGVFAASTAAAAS